MCGATEVDFRLYARVIWRFKWVVMLGLIVAVGLAGLSVVKVGKGGKIAYRQAELWASTARLGVTQQGFPWGRLFAEDPPPPRRHRLFRPAFRSRTRTASTRSPSSTRSSRPATRCAG